MEVAAALPGREGAHAQGVREGGAESGRTTAPLGRPTRARAIGHKSRSCAQIPRNRRKSGAISSSADPSRPARKRLEQAQNRRLWPEFSLFLWTRKLGFESLPRSLKEAAGSSRFSVLSEGDPLRLRKTQPSTCSRRSESATARLRYAGRPSTRPLRPSGHQPQGRSRQITAGFASPRNWLM
jgi:hypothetical protein